MKTIKSKIATVAFALAGTFTASASHAQDTTPSVVIVHGTFADGSDWAKVVPLLQAQGGWPLRLCKTRSPRLPTMLPRRAAP